VTRGGESGEGVEKGGLALRGEGQVVWKRGDGVCVAQLVVEVDELGGSAGEGEIVGGRCVRR